MCLSVRMRVCAPSGQNSYLAEPFLIINKKKNYLESIVYALPNAQQVCDKAHTLSPSPELHLALCEREPQRLQILIYHKCRHFRIIELHK